MKTENNSKWAIGSTGWRNTLLGSILKGKVFIDTATYLANTLERAIEHYNQSVYIIRCIENNFIIHYDEDIEQFKRLRFDINSDTFLRNEDIDLQSIIKP